MPKSTPKEIVLDCVDKVFKVKRIKLDRYWTLVSSPYVITLHHSPCAKYDSYRFIDIETACCKCGQKIPDNILTIFKLHRGFSKVINN